MLLFECLWLNLLVFCVCWSVWFIVIWCWLLYVESLSLPPCWCFECFFYDLVHPDLISRFLRERERESQDQWQSNKWRKPSAWATNIVQSKHLFCPLQLCASLSLMEWSSLETIPNKSFCRVWDCLFPCHFGQCWFFWWVFAGSLLLILCSFDNAKHVEIGVCLLGSIWEKVWRLR